MKTAESKIPLEKALVDFVFSTKLPKLSGPAYANKANVIKPKMKNRFEL